MRDYCPKRVIVFRFLSVLIAIALNAHTQFSYAQAKSAKINEYLNVGQKESNFRGVVLIAQKDSIIFSKGYGLANNKTGLANTPQTIFRLGSLTKQFTAAAILQLHEQGKLNVQDRLCQYIKNCPSTWKEITLHQLLTHTAGVFNYTDLARFGHITKKPHSVEQLISRFSDKSLQFEPGSQWSYSNSGYCLLGYIIEQVSGETYELYLEKHIFKPLQMNSSGYEKETAQDLNRAQGYTKHPLGISKAGYIHMSVPYAAGALYSTAEDLLVWNQALHNGKLLSLKSLQMMSTPYMNEFGYGLRIDNQEGRKRVSHGGRINGFENYIAYYPQNNLLIIVLSNMARIGAESINEDLAKIWFGKTDTAD